MARKKLIVKKKKSKSKSIKRLNIGAGGINIPGYENIDIKTGTDAYPLKYEDNSYDELRCSHILEHFSHRQTFDVMKDWVRVVKPGGILRLAVPNLDFIVDEYKKGSDLPLEGYLMGGHSDSEDHHGAIFNDKKLRNLMMAAGLLDISKWVSEVNDCASLPVSLNLQGRKAKAGEASPVLRKQPNKLPMNVQAAMSVPRLAFMDNYFCAFQALMPFGIGLRKTTGAYWGQCLEKCILECIEEKADAILTIDYDTIFTKNDVENLVSLLANHPEADAISTIQSSRTRKLPMFTIQKNGKNVNNVPFEMFKPELAKITTAHFGLTIIRVKSLLDIPHPWYWSQPDDEGKWGDGRIDDDIWFWRQWDKYKKTLYLANRITIGHAELMIRWPSTDFSVMYQHPSEFWNTGKPDNTWK